MEKRGQINEYTCRTCGMLTHTINLCHGVTPFGIVCPVCDSPECFSGFYRLTRSLPVTEAFYRPAVLPADIATAEFVLSGALIHAPLQRAVDECLRDDPVRAEMTGDQVAQCFARVYSVPPNRVRKK